jgi:ADP-heptose:LPS heptosyltransferase
MSRPRLVILRPLGLGDLLTAIPAMRAAARAFPRHERLLAGPASLAPLAMLSRAIDRVVDTRPLRPLSDPLRHASVAIDLHGRGPASQRILLATSPRRLIAFANPQVPETRGFPEWREEEHEVDRWCRLLSESGIPADPSDLDLEPPPLRAPAITAGAAVLHPGAAYPARRWPVDRWAAVARAIGPNVVITGGPAERDLACTVARLAELPQERVIAGETGVMELAAVVAAAAIVVSGDTGVAHLATALRRPSVVLFGPTAPSRWGPPADRHWHRVIWKGKTGDPNGPVAHPGLLEIEVREVLEEIEALSARRWFAAPAPVH